MDSWNDVLQALLSQTCCITISASRWVGALREWRCKWQRRDGGGTSEQNTEFKEAEPTRNNQGLLMRLASYAETQQRAASTAVSGGRWTAGGGIHNAMLGTEVQIRKLTESCRTRRRNRKRGQTCFQKNMRYSLNSFLTDVRPSADARSARMHPRCGSVLHGRTWQRRTDSSQPAAELTELLTCVNPDKYEHFTIEMHTFSSETACKQIKSMACNSNLPPTIW